MQNRQKEKVIRLKPAPQAPSRYQAGTGTLARGNPARGAAAPVRGQLDWQNKNPLFTMPYHDTGKGANRVFGKSRMKSGVQKKKIIFSLDFPN